MATVPSTNQVSQRDIAVQSTYENIAWKWMRYSGFLLIPLAWGHVLLQDVLVGVHAIDLDYVAMRWATLGWRVYDVLLLAFAFAHGMNGLRQVLDEYIHTIRSRKITAWVIFIVWLVISLIGVIAAIGGVRMPA